MGPADADHPPIVMVHGGCHAAWSWESMQRWFAEHGWRTSALSWYSHGDSDQLPTADWLARDILSVREEIGIVCDAVAAETGRAPVVMAHSMGGLATLAESILGEQQRAALVLLAPVVPAGVAPEPVDIPVDSGSPWQLPPPEAARQLFYDAASDADADRFYPQLQAESPAAVWQATRWTANLPLEPPAGLPILTVAAEHDHLVPAEAVRALAQALGADHLHLPGQGHGLTLNPVHEQVCEHTVQWLDQRLSR